MYIEMPIHDLLNRMLDIIKGIVSHIPGAFYTTTSAAFALSTILNIVNNNTKKAILGNKR